MPSAAALAGCSLFTFCAPGQTCQLCLGLLRSALSGFQRPGKSSHTPQAKQATHSVGRVRGRLRLDVQNAGARRGRLSRHGRWPAPTTAGLPVTCAMAATASRPSTAVPGRARAGGDREAGCPGGPGEGCRAVWICPPPLHTEPPPRAGQIPVLSRGPPRGIPASRF